MYLYRAVLCSLSICFVPSLRTIETPQKIIDITAIEQIDALLEIPEVEVLLYFWLPGCSHCAWMKKHKVLEKIAEKFPRIYYARISAGEPFAPELEKRFSVNNYPTIIIVRDFKEYFRSVNPQLAELLIPGIQKVLDLFPES